jgi:hypothetical protein
MQTFLPLPSFRASAGCLDNRRLGKQRVECKQILLCLGTPIGAHRPKKSSWQNHPAVIMWADHPLALLVYGIVVCREWRRRGFRDNLEKEFARVYYPRRRLVPAHRYPPWFYDDQFHASHRSNLLRKDRDHYSQFGWTEAHNLPYYWPVIKDTLHQKDDLSL